MEGETKEPKKVKKKKKGKKKKKAVKEDNLNIDTLKNFFNQTAPKQGEQWTDDLFPPNENSLLGNNPNIKDSFECQNKEIDTSEIEWKRAREIFPDPHLFEGVISTKNISLGKIGCPYFLSSIAAICEYFQSQIISNYG